MLSIIVFNGCKKEKPEETLTPTSVTRSVNGSAQKGPFLNGTSITVYELNQSYSQTGKSFSTQITDNSGSFALNNISLVSNYVQIRADGFYFNEVCGSNSISQITLNCLTDVASSGAVHINLLTHLEKPRIEYLLNTGISFDSAKNEAQREILNIFNMSSNGIQNSEQLDISQTGEGNGMLLAVSCILQGFRTESELSSLLSVISNDIQSDGVLNDSNAKSSIIDHALLLDTISLRANVSNFYSSLGNSSAIPDFEKHIQHFINNSSFVITNSVITYPNTGQYGPNVLVKTQLTYNTSAPQVSLTGQLKKCSRLKIRLHKISGGYWYYSDHNNMNISSYDFATNEQFFTVIDSDLPFDVRLSLTDPGTFLVEYFEKDLLIPSFSKTITVI